MAGLAKIAVGLLFLIGAAAAVSWMGLLPTALNPLGPLSLDKRDQWFVDAKLAALRYDPGLCRKVLDRRFVDAAPKPDRPLQEGCGWTNSLEFTQISGVKLPVYVLTCEATAALALWIRHEVQPAAISAFGSPVAKIDHFGTYSCRNVAGREWRSQHASANAIDISGFTRRSVPLLSPHAGPGLQRRPCRPLSLGPRSLLGLSLGPARPSVWRRAALRSSDICC